MWYLYIQIIKIICLLLSLSPPQIKPLHALRSSPPSTFYHLHLIPANEQSRKCTMVMLKSLWIILRCSGIDQYSTHTPTVEAPSVSLKWHLRLSSVSHSASEPRALHIPHIRLRHSPLFCMSSKWWVFCFSDTQTSLQCILRYLFKGCWSVAVNNFSVG